MELIIGLILLSLVFGIAWCDRMLRLKKRLGEAERRALEKYVEMLVDHELYSDQEPTVEELPFSPNLPMDEGHG